MSNNTKKSFHDKWKKNSNSFFKETLDKNHNMQQWILNRNGFKTFAKFSAHLKNKRNILDAGCGNGRVTALLYDLAPLDCKIVGVDLVAADIAKKNFKDKKRVFFKARDLTDNLNDLGKFDFIYCQEVLHHTLNPFLAFKNLCMLLEPKGEIAIYVYKKKAAVREFTDDYIREKIKNLSYDDAMLYCSQITKLGKLLTELNIKIKVPEVKLFEIEEGEYDVQRLLYHFFAKCFWNPKLSFKDNALINYDWYHPQISTRHTINEVKQWFVSNGLKIIHQHVDFYGITVRGIKQNQTK
ncbi:SmtA SAM-dependent methyltransferases [Candidatus Pelagibacterales bacterium]